MDGNSGTLYRLVDADGALSVLTVPVVVDASGANGARFVSELTLGNRGATDASVAVTFTASTALGSTGSGTFTTTVPAGRQLVFTDALQWLRQNGLFIPLGNEGGTLRLAYSGLLSGDAAFASVRTLAVLPEGRAGLAYPALAPNETLEAPAALYGLREDTVFRSNLALLNAGDPATGAPVTLRVTVHSGAAGDGRSVTLSDVTLDAGQWTQLNRVLQSAGYANGWATVERVAGTDAFYAYGVVNDNLTGDGAFIAPVPAGRKTDRLMLPVAVHTGAFTTELCLTNAGTTPRSAVVPGPPWSFLRARTQSSRRGSSDSSRTCSRTSAPRLPPRRLRFFFEWWCGGVPRERAHVLVLARRRDVRRRVSGDPALGGGAVGDVGLRTQAGRADAVESRPRRRRPAFVAAPAVVSLLSLSMDFFDGDTGTLQGHSCAHARCVVPGLDSS